MIHFCCFKQLQNEIIITIRMGCGAVNPNHVDTQNSNTLLTLNHIYEKKELIGSGTFGKVYRCINKLNGLQYALKVVEITAKSKEEAIKQINSLKSQIGVLKKLNHKNIVKYYSFDISEDNKQVEIVLQYAKHGSLKNYLQERGTLGQLEASQKTAQILEGLKYLHEENIVHRDLKCANILMMEDGTLKISDFGTAKYIKIKSNEDIAKLCSSLKGTPYYMAPQILRRTGHSISADIWSLGCLVIQMLSGKAPWTALTTNFQQIISYIVSGIHPPFPKGISEQCLCFLSSCCDNVPSQRLNATELLKHRWIDHKSLAYFDEKISKGKQNSIVKSKDIQLTQEMQIIADTKNLKQQKYKQIQNYVSQRNKISQKRKMSSQRGSAKPKKEKVGSIKMSQEKINRQEFDIEVIPHIQNQQPLARNLFNAPPIKKEEGLKITKTAPHQVKLPESIISQLQQIEEQTIQISNQVNFNTSATSKDTTSTRVKTQNEKGDFIDTMISREQRNRYIEQQKIIRDQREEEKRKWERQLKEGANFLRKEINVRYNI